MNLKIAGNLSHEQKAKIAAEFTDTLKRIAHKPESYTYVVIEEVKFEDWAIAGKLLSD